MIKRYYLDTSFIIAILDKEIDKEFLKSLFTHLLYFSGIGLVELAMYCERNHLKTKVILDEVKSRFRIMQISPDTAINSTKIRKSQRKKHPKFGTMDAIHYATSQSKDCIFLTKDNDFQGLQNVKIV